MWGDECYVTAFLMEINTSYTENIQGEVRTDILTDTDCF